MLTTARDLDRLGRRVERFLSMQLKQLEISIARFDREREAWLRRRQAELAQIEQSRQALADAWEDLKAHRGDRGVSGESVDTSKLPARPPDTILSQGLKRMFQSGAASETSPPDGPELKTMEDLAVDSGEDAAGTGSAPLKLLLDPGTASEEWLAGLLIEISKLNRELGGSGLRFELSHCRRTERKRARPSSPGGPLTGLLLELELYSRQPLIELGGGAHGSDVSGDLLVWERYKSAMLLTSLIDRRLSRDFEKARASAGDASDRQRIAKLLHRAEDAIIRIEATRAPASLGAGGNACKHHTDAEVRVRQQVTRLETVAAVIADECTSRVHVSLV